MKVEYLTLEYSSPRWLVCKPPWGGRGRWYYKVSCLFHNPWVMIEIGIREVG